MVRNPREVAIGAATLIVGALVLAFVFSGSGRARIEGYEVSARFQRTDGLEAGAPVRLSGLRVGTVLQQSLDPNFRAVVTMRIAPDVRLPEDTAALIHTDGLLGEKFVTLQPGGAEEMIPPGGSITYTQDAVIIEDLLAFIIAEAKAKRGDGAPGAEP